MQELVEKIYTQAVNYHNYIKKYGNECAYTDRMVEEIILNAQLLAKEYAKI